MLCEPMALASDVWIQVHRCEAIRLACRIDLRLFQILRQS